MKVERSVWFGDADAFCEAHSPPAGPCVLRDGLKNPLSYVLARILLDLIY